MATSRTAETAVLNVLAPGGLLTLEQVAAQAHLTGRATRRTLGRLMARGLIGLAYHSRWTITQQGVRVTGGRQ
ncbi:hypothetical protein [Nocardia sp. 852002-20019_SCH5090214]|uniref:hypothetical protein n=1 Tax=Nocardia sp. 852002-20019_SCH5090214 TaxID=1834087 RepID=UPI000AC94589|nr:hypothetical protein [Nocardia sp. 852002-20019_SCH5090214]